MVMRLVARPSLIGVALEPGYIRLARLQRQKHGAILSYQGELNVPMSAIQGGWLSDTTSLKQQIAEFIKDESLSGAKVAVNIHAKFVHFKRLLLPIGLTHEEILAELHLQLPQQLIKQPHSWSIDYRLSGDQSQQDYTHVYGAAVDQKHLQAIKEMLQIRKLQLKVIAVDVCVLIRLLKYMQSEISNDQVHALFDLKHLSATFVIWRENDIIFHQHWYEGDRSTLSQQQWMRHCLQVPRIKEVETVYLFPGEEVMSKDFFASCSVNVEIVNIQNHFHSAKSIESFTLPIALAMCEVFA